MKTLYVSDENHHHLRIVALKRGVTLQELSAEIIENFLNSNEVDG